MQTILDQAVGAITTTDATPTLLCALTIPANSGGSARITVVCRDPATGEVAHQVKVGLMRHNGTSVVAVGSITTVAQAGNASLAAVSTTLDGSGNTVRVIATGIAGRPLDWFGRISATVLA